MVSNLEYEHNVSKLTDMPAAISCEFWSVVSFK